MANEGGRGFANMDGEKQREIGRKGGASSHGGGRDSDLSGENRSSVGQRSSSEQSRDEQGRFGSE